MNGHDVRSSAFRRLRLGTSHTVGGFQPRCRLKAELRTLDPKTLEQDK